MKRANFRLLITGLLTAGACAPAVGQVAFSGLGDLPSGTGEALAWTISDDGTTVGGYAVVSGPSGIDIQGFVWQESTGMIGLPTLRPGVIANECWGLSGDGSIAAGSSASAPGSTDAVIWVNGQVQSLGHLPGGLQSSRARSVSRDGGVVVGMSSSAEGPQAFRWEGGIMEPLGDIPGGIFGSFATAVSADGEVVVGFGVWGHSSQESEAFRWENGEMVGLGDLPGGRFGSNASGVSGDGRVVVGSSRVDAPFFGNNHAFRWTEATGMIDLNDLAAPDWFGGAAAVADDGWRIVGTATFGGQAAAIWDPIRGTQSLKQVLKQEHGLDLTGWWLRNANDISADGTAIAGDGSNPQGDFEPWLARIPPFCYADCDQSSAIGVLDLQDFLCYQQRFLSGDLYSDCNQDGDHDIFDFLCFQDHFFEGCGS